MSQRRKDAHESRCRLRSIESCNNGCMFGRNTTEIRATDSAKTSKRTLLQYLFPSSLRLLECIIEIFYAFVSYKKCKMMIEYGIATTEEDLEQIVQLQSANLKDSLTPEETKQEGFLSLQYDVSILKAMMGREHAHVVARKQDGAIVGYTLVCPRDFCNDSGFQTSCLGDIARVMDHVVHCYGDKRTSTPLRSYIVMGQVCVDKTVRGTGVFAGLYASMKERLSPQYDCIVTAIHKSNQRSWRAHEKIGFQVLRPPNRKSNSCGCGDGDDGWCIVLWDWRKVPTGDF